MNQDSASGGGKHRAALCILAGGILWGLIGVWNRRLMADGLTPTDIVVIRNMGGCVLLSMLFALRDRSVFRIRPAHLKYFFGTGFVSVVLFTVCYFSCQRICSLAAASILLYTAPSFVVILSAVLWREKITKTKLSALLITLLGCALVCGIFSGGTDNSVTPAGILLGLGSGFFYALYSIFGRYALKYYTPAAVTVWTFLIAGPCSLFLLRPAVLTESLSRPGTLLYASGLAVFSTALPYLLYTAGLAEMESGRASILASVEPVAAALAGGLLFYEPLGVGTVAGIFCVLAGVYILR